MMEQLLLKKYSHLPKHLQTEVLHFIEFLAQKAKKQSKAVKPSTPKKAPLTFSDFRFPENGQSYSRSEIYGDDGR
ncbi:MAG: DUF2281 domain-containing protein [Saprospiraceae bacterium]